MSEKARKNYEMFAVILFFSIVTFSFLYFTGTLTSGYHFIDDHGMISIKNSLKEAPFVETVLNYTKNDFLIRFRPFYYFYYVSVVQIFNLNFFAMSVFAGILATLSFAFFYLGARKLNHGTSESLFFVLLAFIGSQSAIWWRLGTNETIGMFFLGLAFLFMAKCANKEKYKLNNIIFVILLIISSLCKESFIIIIPAFVVFKIWNEKNVFGITTKESIKNNYLSVIPVIVMFIELLIIKFVVGTNKIGYAGFTSSMDEFTAGIKNILFNNHSLFAWIKFIETLFILYFFSFLSIKERRKTIFAQSLKSIGAYCCFAVLIIAPNILMHAKSGMIERYLLPTTLGLSFLVVGILKNTKQSLFRIAMYGIILFFILASFNAAKTNAVNFAIEGNDANALLSAVKNNSSTDSKMLLVVDPVDRFEVSDSTKIYLSYYGLNNLYAYPMLREYKTDFEEGLLAVWEKWFENRKLENMNGQPDLIIMIDKKQAVSFFDKSGLVQGHYKDILADNSKYSLFIKK